MKAPESIKKYMTVKPITFRPNQPIYEVIKIMVNKKISGAPVLDENDNLVGVISEKDCLRVLVDSAYHHLPAGSVADYMSTNVKAMSEEKSIVEVADEFLHTHYKRFPVINKAGKLIGQISRADILRAINDFKDVTWDEIYTKVDTNVIKPNYKDSRMESS